MATACVHAEKVHFGFDPQAPLFNDLSFDIPPAGVTWVQGGESRGKTTLLRLLAGQLQPLKGTVRMDGVDLHAPEMSARIYAHDPRQPMWDQQTPMQFFTQLALQYPRFDPAVVSAMLVHLQLAEHADKAMFMLSTGSQRKVSWVAALACGADLLLIDDPFAALDLTSIRKLHQLLAEGAGQHHSAWVLADYVSPGAVPLAGWIDLGD